MLGCYADSDRTRIMPEGILSDSGLMSAKVGHVMAMKRSSFFSGLGDGDGWDRVGYSPLCEAALSSCWISV